MAHYAKQEEIDKLAAEAKLLESDDHSNFNGDETGAIARETSPWQRGHIVFADLGGELRRVLVDRIQLEKAQGGRYYGEWVNHVAGFIERKDGKGWGRMYRHIGRGYITRGYELARKQGLVPPIVDEI